MEHKIIQTENYLLVVSNEEIKNKDWIIDAMITKNVIRRAEVDKELGIWAEGRPIKIIAHLPLNNSPILQGVDLLPPLEQKDDVEEKRDLWVKSLNGMIPDKISAAVGFKNGYNKAKEKYKYTEEDMREMFEAAIGLSSFSDTDDNKFQYALQFLSQPKMPIGFECETNILSEIPTDIRSHIYDKTYEVPKTTTNGQYQTLWVGEYVYEN